ncbi:uncharacterized protein LOC131045169 [Cryptomeria japonica]|uniref:uncharacterized protein LOC131045169 n=1 Tax=Cryptomeria japonica TaxID=3369 RepID=UPI0025ACE7F7|nr:uncharacterized protein LOC131045169 [Cryptomeria japonica]
MFLPNAQLQQVLPTYYFLQLHRSQRVHRHTQNRNKIRSIRVWSVWACMSRRNCQVTGMAVDFGVRVSHLGYFKRAHCFKIWDREQPVVDRACRWGFPRTGSERCNWASNLQRVVRPRGMG